MRGNFKTTIAVILLLGIIATAIIAVISDGFTLPVEEWGKGGSQEAPNEDAAPDKDDDGNAPGGDTTNPGTPGTGENKPSTGSSGGVTDENGNKLDQNGVSPMPQAMAFSVDETDGNGSVTIIASIEPTDATNKDVEWDVQFVNPESEWASGKNVEDYISLMADTVATGICTVTCKQPFGEQIVVTAKSAANPEVKQSCTVDYKQRLLDIYMEINGEKFEAEEDFPLYGHTGIDYLISANTNVSFELNENYPGEEYVFDYQYETSEIYTKPLDIDIERDYRGYASSQSKKALVIDVLSDENKGQVLNFNINLLFNSDAWVYDRDLERPLSIEELEKLKEEDIDSFANLRFHIPSVKFLCDGITIECEISLDADIYFNADFSYLESGDIIAITGMQYPELYEGKKGCHIPETINGKPVRFISSLPFKDRSDAIVYIPDSVIDIRPNAFLITESSSLDSLTINYGGTITQWQENLPSEFFIGTYNSLGGEEGPPITLNCSDGTIKLTALAAKNNRGIKGKVFTFSVRSQPFEGEVEPPDTEPGPVFPAGFYIVGLTDYGKTLSSIEIAYSDGGIPITGILEGAFDESVATEIKLLNPELIIAGEILSDYDTIESLTISDPDKTLIDYFGEDVSNSPFIPGGVPESLKEIVLTESVTHISSKNLMNNVYHGTFEGCSYVENIFILGSLSAVDAKAFDDADSLENIYYSGTEEEWASLNVDIPSGCTMHYNYDPNEVTE